MLAVVRDAIFSPYDAQSGLFVDRTIEEKDVPELVKDEAIRVAERHRTEVKLVCDGGLRRPQSPWAELVIVPEGADAADDWIAEHADARSIVITADILLAERCLKAGAQVLAHNGKPFDTASIGAAVATRAIMDDLRAGMDGIGGGPPPFSKADRSNFLQALDRVLTRLR